MNLLPQTDLPDTESAAAPAIAPRASAGDFGPVLQSLSRSFAEPFSLVNVVTGDLIHADYDGLSCDLFGRVELLAEVARRDTPEIIEDVAPLCLLAIPLTSLPKCKDLVAVGAFVTQSFDHQDQFAAAAQSLGIDAGRAFRWAEGRDTWPPHALMRIAEAAIRNLSQDSQLVRLRQQAEDAIDHADDADVELGLLHRLTRHLNLSDTESELWQSALEWLADAVPAQCLTILSDRREEQNQDAQQLADESRVLTHGECPIDSSEVAKLLDGFGSIALRRPLLLNRADTALPTWHCPTVRELVCVPIPDGNTPMGWLLALNHSGTDLDELGQFGSVEIRLLSTVATILGIHTSNIRLFQKQSELFASSVQALTSAIDAKDEYTAGHSDRVARVSVTLATRLGLDKQLRETIYLAGLLHDIGKIGIDDHVLKKPGELTEEEYEHIKTHPQLGHDILKGVQQLEKVLPMVLHHHEAWDGSGYPHGLKGKETPLMARIMAVADAFDAMSSDRPYRRGMPDEKLDGILRGGAGSHWDPDVVDAFFAVRDEIRAVVRTCDQDASPQLNFLVN